MLSHEPSRCSCSNIWNVEYSTAARKDYKQIKTSVSHQAFIWPQNIWNKVESLMNCLWILVLLPVHVGVFINEPFNEKVSVTSIFILSTHLIWSQLNTLWDSPTGYEHCYHWRGKHRPAKRCGLRAVVPLLVTLYSSVSSSCELDGWFGWSSGVLTH